MGRLFAAVNNELSINTLLLTPSGRFYDLYGGIEDLKKYTARLITFKGNNPTTQFDLLQTAKIKEKIDSYKLSADDGLKKLIYEFRATALEKVSLIGLLNDKGNIAGAIALLRDWGILGRLIPEFEDIRGLHKDESKHKYPVDEHTLQALKYAEDPHREINSLDIYGVGLFNIIAKTAGDIRDDIKNEDISHILRLAILFHDIGKGRYKGEEGPVSHTETGVDIAADILKRPTF